MIKSLVGNITCRSYTHTHRAVAGKSAGEWRCSASFITLFLFGFTLQSVGQEVKHGAVQVHFVYLKSIKIILLHVELMNLINSHMGRTPRKCIHGINGFGCNLLLLQLKTQFIFYLLRIQSIALENCPGNKWFCSVYPECILDERADSCQRSKIFFFLPGVCLAIFRISLFGDPRFVSEQMTTFYPPIIIRLKSFKSDDLAIKIYGDVIAGLLHWLKVIS